MIIYSFRAGGFARNDESVVCVGEAHLIEAALGHGMLTRTFFGNVHYQDDGGPEFVGVWGARNSSRLRRLLRAAGAELIIFHRPPPARLRGWGTAGKARFEARRRLRKLRVAADLIERSRPYPMI